MSRISSRVGAGLKTVPGVKNVAVQMGRAIFGDQVVNINAAELWVSIDQSANYDQTAAAIQNIVNGYPGLHHKVTTYLNEITSDVGVQKNNSLTVRVYGATDQALKDTANGVKAALQQISGVVSANIKLPT